jgi:hypothetical protein
MLCWGRLIDEEDVSNADCKADVCDSCFDSRSLDTDDVLHDQLCWQDIEQANRYYRPYKSLSRKRDSGLVVSHMDSKGQVNR